jgi:hypothetical protein
MSRRLQGVGGPRSGRARANRPGAKASPPALAKTETRQLRQASLYLRSSFKGLHNFAALNNDALDFQAGQQESISNPVLVSNLPIWCFA